MILKSVISLSRLQKAWILFLIDVGLVFPVFYAILALQTAESGPLLPVLEAYSRHLPLLAACAGGLTSAFGLNRLRLREFQGAAVMRAVKMSGVLGVCSAILMAFVDGSFHIGFNIIFAMVYFSALFLARQLLTRILTEIYRHSHAFIRVAIYGAGRTGMALARELKRSNDVIVYAFLDDNATLSGMSVNGLPVYSGVHAARIKEQYKINRVILAMPSLSADKQTFLSERLQRLGLEVQTLPAFAQLYGGGELLDKLSSAGVVSLLSRDPLNEAMVHGCSAYRRKNILISGAGGSIGLELCRQVMACRPAKLVLFDLSELALYNAEAEMRVLAETAGVKIVPVLGSVADAVQVAQILDDHQINVVLHAAAYKHVPLVEMNARVGMANNALGTAVLARAARAAQVERFVLVSSDKAVRPGNLMGASKRFAELVVQDLAARSSRTIFSIVRFGNVLGSSGSVIPLFQEQIARGGPVTLTDERVTRYFMTIQEAARLVLLAGSLAEGGEVYVLDMGKPVRIGELARRMIAAAGYTLRDADHPDGDIEIATTGLRPGEKLHEELMVRRGAQATTHPKIIRVREDHLSELETAAALRALSEAIDRGCEAEVIEVVARTIREYAPQSLPENALQCQIVMAHRSAELSAE